MGVVMPKRLRLLVNLVAFFLGLMGAAPAARGDRALEPIVYTIKLSAPDKRIAEVEATVPTEKRASIELMMALWSPGFYRIENYASRVQGLSARTPGGTMLPV